MFFRKTKSIEKTNTNKGGQHERIKLQKLRRAAAVPERGDGAKVLGIAPSSSYELMHEKDFPTLRIGNRIVVPKEAFIQWVEQHTGGTE